MPEELVLNPSGYDMPKPTRFLILDDLSQGDVDTEASLRELSTLVDSRTAPILVNTSSLEQKVQDKYQRALAEGTIATPAMAIGIGRVGNQIAQDIHVDISLLQINPTRSKREDGSNFIGTKSGIPLEEEINETLRMNNVQPISEEQTILLVDDTIFGGTTLRSVIDILKQSFPNAHFVALTLTYIPSRTQAELNSVENLQIIAGLTLRGIPSEERGLNSIDARDFIEDDALRLEGGVSIPFSEEENWMRS